MSHRFTLKPYKKRADRLTCPSCGKKACFSPYIDTETGEILKDDVGRCDREVNCGHHYKPAEYFADNPEVRAKYFGLDDDEQEQGTTTRAKTHKVVATPPTSFIPDQVFNLSLSQHEGNNFIKYLNSLFPREQVSAAVASYLIGSSKQWPGSTVFWQVSLSGEIRAGKIMLYNSETGKRVKEPYNHITWAHKALGIEEYNLKQCFFGEHLLRIKPNNPVAIVESEKTAIIASVYLPEFVWLACGSLHNLSLSKSSVLAGREVTLFPDLNAYEKWQLKAAEIEAICTVSVSDMLEQIAEPEERERGLDIADYFTRISLQDVALGLRDQYKAEYLTAGPMDDAAQYRLWEQYKGFGLHPGEAKAVLQELITQYNFILS